MVLDPSPPPLLLMMPFFSRVCIHDSWICDVTCCCVTWFVDVLVSSAFSRGTMMMSFLRFHTRACIRLIDMRLDLLVRDMTRWWISVQHFFMRHHRDIFFEGSYACVYMTHWYATRLVGESVCSGVSSSWYPHTHTRCVTHAYMTFTICDIDDTWYRWYVCVTHLSLLRVRTRVCTWLIDMRLDLLVNQFVAGFHIYTYIYVYIYLYTRICHGAACNSDANWHTNESRHICMSHVHTSLNLNLEKDIVIWGGYD